MLSQNYRLNLILFQPIALKYRSLSFTDEAANDNESIRDKIGKTNRLMSSNKVLCIDIFAIFIYKQ